MRYPIATAISLVIRQQDARSQLPEAEELPPLTRRWPRIAAQSGDAGALAPDVSSRTASGKPATAM